MLDIHSFLKAQKVMWVKRLTEPGQASWKAVPLLYLKELLGINTFKCNLSCVEKPTDLPDFYWHIIKSWNEVKTIVNNLDNPLDIRRECLWLNKNIKIGKKEVNWDIWKDKGIYLIHDIVKKDGSFMTNTEFELKFGIKNDFLNFSALKDAIPQEWRKKLKTMKIPAETISSKEPIYLYIGKNAKRLSQIVNKDIYWIFVNKIKEFPIIFSKLRLDQEEKQELAKNIFTIPKVVRNTKIRAFQYKVLYKLIPCNQYLNKIKKSDTDKCNKCNILDDLKHYFYKCEEIKTFWNRFSNWWKEMTGEEIQLDEIKTIYGIVDNLKKNEILNACILNAKWYIYKCKLNEKNIFFYSFLCDLKFFLIIEKTIALRNNNYEKYLQLWLKIEEYIT
jgi:hypothetical protein